MHTYGLMPAPLALLALVLFAALPQPLPGRGRVGHGRAVRRPAGLARPGDVRRRRPSHCVFAAAFTLAELARGHFFTGFPWLAIGYAQVDGPSRAMRRWPAAMASASPPAWWLACWPALLVGLRAGTDHGVACSWRHCVARLALAAACGMAARDVAWSQPGRAPLEGPPAPGQRAAADEVRAGGRAADDAALPGAGGGRTGRPDRPAGDGVDGCPGPSTPPELAQRLERFVQASGSAVAIGMPLTTPVPGAGGPAAAQAPTPATIDRAHQQRAALRPRGRSAPAPGRRATTSATWCPSASSCPGDSGGSST